MNSKKALSIGINMIVIISVALIVLLVVTGYFFGAFGTVGGGIQQVGAGAEAAAPTESAVGENITDITDMWGP